jgi:hypothetical protein
MYQAPSYVWALLLIGAIGIPATTCAMLYRGAIAAGLGRRTATGVTIVAAVVLGGWIVASSLLARAEVYYRDPNDATPWLGLVFVGVAFGGTLLALLGATRLPIARRVLADPGTPARLALPHTLRVVGVVFLIVMAQGYLPAVFALPAGLGDIAIGVSAPLVAWRLASGTGHRTAVRFNALGILDLVVAVTIAVLAAFLKVSPSTEALGLLPLALAPTVAVPLAIALHVVSLRRLRSAARLKRTEPVASSRSAT